MSIQVKLHAKQLLGIPLVAGIKQMEDELNKLLSEGWILSGNLLQVTNQSNQMVIIQPLLKETNE